MKVNWAQDLNRMSDRELEAAMDELIDDLSEGVDYPKLRARLAEIKASR